MSMPNLWSNDALAPKSRQVNRQFAMVPRERVYGKPKETPPLPMVVHPSVEVAAWVEGFRAAEIILLTTVTYGEEPPPERPSHTMTEIIREVAKKHGMPASEIKSDRRHQAVVIARHEAIWRCRHETLNSLCQIGRAFGGKDHTTVLNAIRRHEQRMAKEAEAG